jgi:hypothetical protein
MKGGCCVGGGGVGRGNSDSMIFRVVNRDSKDRMVVSEVTVLSLMSTSSSIFGHRSLSAVSIYCTE